MDNRGLTYAEHAEAALLAAEAVSNVPGGKMAEQVNLHHAQTYALVSIARSLETIARRRTDER